MGRWRCWRPRRGFAQDRRAPGEAHAPARRRPTTSNEELGVRDRRHLRAVTASATRSFAGTSSPLRTAAHDFRAGRDDRTSRDRSASSSSGTWARRVLVALRPDPMPVVDRSPRSRDGEFDMARAGGRRSSSRRRVLAFNECDPEERRTHPGDKSPRPTLVATINREADGAIPVSEVARQFASTRELGRDLYGGALGPCTADAVSLLCVVGEDRQDGRPRAKVELRELDSVFWVDEPLDEADRVAEVRSLPRAATCGAVPCDAVKPSASPGREARWRANHRK